jgi:hypothetical protein
LAAYGLLSWLGESRSAYATLFLLAFIPAVVSVLVLTRIPEHMVLRMNVKIYSKTGNNLAGI